MGKMSTGKVVSMPLKPEDSCPPGAPQGRCWLAKPTVTLQLALQQPCSWGSKRQVPSTAHNLVRHASVSHQQEVAQLVTN